MATLQYMIAPDGNVTFVGSQGYGSKCVEATKGFEERAGKSQFVEHTEDFHTETIKPTLTNEE